MTQHTKQKIAQFLLRIVARLDPVTLQGAKIGKTFSVDVSGYLDPTKWTEICYTIQAVLKPQERGFLGAEIVRNNEKVSETLMKVDLREGEGSCIKSTETSVTETYLKGQISNVRLRDEGQLDWEDDEDEDSDVRNTV